jgi:uroporphyrinogen-III synthase
MAAETPLAGLRVLVTRPAHQAQAFCTLLERDGATVIRFPVIAIGPSPDPQAVAATATGLGRFDLVIFISANAVQRGLPLLCPKGDWPAATAIAAVGRGTAAELVAQGLRVDLVPATGHNSEALLALPALADMAGRRVLIVRGDGGREALATELRSRGAAVDYAEVYRRVLPQVDVSPLLRTWRKGGVDLVTVTSGQTLRNLSRMLGVAGQAALQSTALILASENVRQVALELGCRGPLEVAADATDAAMLAALRHWHQCTRGF